MKSLLFPLSLLLCICVYSCSEYQKVPLSTILDKTIGKSENEIIIAMGVPDKTDPDGNGGKIISYEKNAIFTQQRISANIPNTISSNSITGTVSHYLQFYINGKGVVYHYRTNYNQIVKVIKDSDGKIIKIKS